MRISRYLRKICLLLSVIFVIGITFSKSNVQAIAKNSEENIDLVILFNNNIDNKVEDFIKESGGKIITRFPDIGGLDVECDTKLIPQLKAYDAVKSVAPNHNIKIKKEKRIDFDDYRKTKLALNSVNNESESNDLYNDYQWDIKRVTNNGKSFQLCSGNHNVIIGIIDSGIKKNHPDLERNFLGGENLVPSGFNNDETETGDLEDIDDRVGHGTYIAGNIAANGRVKGVAPDIGFKSYRIFDSNENTNATIASSAIIKATDDGVKVINLSMGGYDLKGKCYWTDPKSGVKHNLGDGMAEYELYKRAIKYAIKHNVVVVTSAGNDGIDCGDTKKLTEILNKQNDGFTYEGLTYEVPGAINGVINVSATGANDVIASYSNYGEKFIDVAAPGGDSSHPCLSTGISNTGYVFGEGTSIAAPKVSAIAGLILCKNPNLKPNEVAKKIYKTCDKISGAKSEAYYGAGLANAYKALSKNK